MVSRKPAVQGDKAAPGKEARRRRRRMNETSIGYAGIDGVWWRQAVEPIDLPGSLAEELVALGGAIFTLLDVVQDAYRQDATGTLGRMLRYKVPEPIRSWASSQPVLSFRPDFQLKPLSNGGYLPVVTEVEICPSAHGFAHALQVGYGLKRDLVEDFRWMLDGRPFLIAGSVAWSAFVWEQLAFCRALEEAGGSARVIYDRPLLEIVHDIENGRIWQPPMFGVKSEPAAWNSDLVGRLEANQLRRFFWSDGLEWPRTVGRSMVMRFGYVENFSLAHLDRFRHWMEAGASFLNPASFILDSKAIMVAVGLPEVRSLVSEKDSGALRLLDRHIPTTILLTEDTLEPLVDERQRWIIKYAGFDGGDRAWGGRSLVVGAEETPVSWRRELQAGAGRSWPVVAQHLVPSLRQDMAYADQQGVVHWMRGGRTRLRAFFCRHGGRIRASGAHVTLSPSGTRVAEGTDSIQTPIRFV